jgi:hypothetical protein
MTVPLGPVDLARRAAELRELLDAKESVWPPETVYALRQRITEVESAALDLAVALPIGGVNQ